MSTKSTQTKAVEAVKSEFVAQKAGGEFTAKKCAAVGEAAIKAMTTKDGKAIEVSDNDVAAIRGVFYPTVENRKAMLNAMFDKCGADVDEDMIGLLAEFFNPAAVQAKIEAAKKQPRIGIREMIEAGTEEA